jgi:transcriptional regulator with XRE-family HTH domain
VTKAKRLKELQDQLAVNVQSILIEKGWSQQDLADKLKKNKSHISQILHSKVNLTLRLIVEIEDALDKKIINMDDRPRLKD